MRRDTLRFRGLPSTIVFLIAFGVQGCASTPPTVLVTEPDQRLQFNGFSVLPPDGERWHWVGRESQDTTRLSYSMFVKKSSRGRPSRNTYLAKAAVLDAGERQFTTTQELLSHVRAMGLFQESPRQQNMRVEFAVDDTLAPLCVRFDLNAEDTRVGGYAGPVYLLDAHGLFCVHPEAPDVLVMIDHSRRTRQGDAPVAAQTEGERFLSSLRFTPIQRHGG